MLPDELGQRAARALVSIAAALRGDDGEFPWSEPDPVGVGIALQVLNCLPERNTIGKGPVYRIAFREVLAGPGRGGRPRAQAGSIGPCRPNIEKEGNDARDRLSDSAAGGPDYRPVREDAGPLPSEGERAGVREARGPGALPAQGPGRLGASPAARLDHGRRDRAHRNGPMRGGPSKMYAACPRPVSGADSALVAAAALPAVQ